MVIDVLTSVLSGSLFGPYVRDLYTDFNEPACISHVFGAINVLNGDSIQFTYTLTINAGGS